MSEAVERREPIEVESTATSIPSNVAPSFDARDLALDRLRVVGKDARLVELEVAKPGDIAIGVDAEDEDSTVYPSPGGLRFYVITWRSNYSCGYGQQQGQWEEDDPNMPACAKKQYHAMIFVPEYDRMMPVLFTANGGVAKTFRQVITKIARNGIDRPYELAFKMTTKTCSGTPSGQTAPKSWPCPVIELTEPDEEEVKLAEGLFESMVGTPRAQLSAGDSSTDSSTPSF